MVSNLYDMLCLILHWPTLLYSTGVTVHVIVPQGAAASHLIMSVVAIAGLHIVSEMYRHMPMGKLMNKEACRFFFFFGPLPFSIFVFRTSK